MEEQFYRNKKLRLRKITVDGHHPIRNFTQATFVRAAAFILFTQKATGTPYGLGVPVAYVCGRTLKHDGSFQGMNAPS